MKFCAATVLCVITATSADRGQKNDRNLAGCPPPNRPPPPPLANGGSWTWVCRPVKPSKPSWGAYGGRWEDDGYSAEESDDGDDGKWGDDGYAVEETDDGKWGDDGYAVEETDNGKWGDDGYTVEETYGGSDDGKWGDDGHVVEVEATDDWNGDGHVIAESDDSVVDDGKWGDDGHVAEETNDSTGDDAAVEEWAGDGHSEEVVGEDWEGDGYEGEESVDTWDDDGYGDREPVIESDLGEESAEGYEGHEPAFDHIEEEDVDHEGTETNSVPSGAIGGAAAAAGVAAIIALMVARRHKANRFIDGEEKDSIGTDEDHLVPTPEQKMATDEDIEIDHTFFDENLFQENYQEQEMAYEDDDLSTINEDDLRFTGDERSV